MSPGGTRVIHPKEGVGQGPEQVLRPSGWAMFAACFAALGIIWMPLVLLRQIDAFVAFLTPLELARDTGLAYLLLLLPAAALAALGKLAARISSALGAPAGWAASLGWAVVLLPTLWVCVWQLAASSWAWLRAVTGTDWSMSPQGRVLASLVLLALLILAMHRLGPGGLMRWVVSRLSGVAKPALALILPAVIAVMLDPPRFSLGGKLTASTPAAVSVSKPDIFLITIDTLAEQDARVCADGPTLMPRLREFAQRASCFRQHYANGNFTTPSTATIETGALPWTHWAVQIVSRIAEPLQGPSLAARLRDAGYETHSISANLLASPRHHGTELGYDRHKIADSSSLGIKPRQALTAFPNTTLAFWLSSLIPFLDTIDVYTHGPNTPYAPEYAYAEVPPLLNRGGKPKFVWVHTLPPHDPYLPPAATKYKLLARGELERWSEFLPMGPYAPEQQSWIDKHRLRYKESIMGADLALGRLLDQLEREGRLENALVIISSDHGESFVRGFMGHAGEMIHNAVLQVPLVVKLPGQTQGQIVDTPVSLADLAPTMVDYAGADPLPAADGRSLRPALEGRSFPVRPVYAMAMERQSRFEKLRYGHYAIIEGQHKLVLHLAEQRIELYDLAVDPGEERDIASLQPEVAGRLRAALEQQLAAVEARRSQAFVRP